MLNVLIKACLVGLLPIMAMAQNANDLSVEKIGTDVEFVEGETLPFDNRAGGMVSYISSQMTVSSVGGSGGGVLRDINAMRILVFSAQPGERITFNMKSEQSKVMMAVYPDEKVTSLKAAFMKSNMSPASARAKKLIFTNTSKEPYDVSVVLYGTHGYKYHLTWERKPKK